MVPLSKQGGISTEREKVRQARQEPLPHAGSSIHPFPQVNNSSGFRKEESLEEGGEPIHIQEPRFKRETEQTLLPG